MTRPMRRKDRRSGDEEARQLLAQGEYGVLSMSDGEGPYGVPISYAYDAAHGESAGGELYFHSAPVGRKIDALLTQAKASFCVVGATEVLPDKFSTHYESVIASGTVRELLGDEKLQALYRLVEKYSPEFLAEGKAYIQTDAAKTRVLAMRVEELSGKHRV